MNTQIQEAAMKWSLNLSSVDASKFGLDLYGLAVSRPSNEEIVSIWIEEVVMKWWKNGGCSRLEIAKKYCHLYDFSKPLSNSDVAEIYLREHESKEVSNVSDEWILLSDKKPSPFQLITAFWNDDTETDCQWDGQDYENGLRIIKWKQFEKGISNVSEINNCDGCRAGMPLRNGIYHVNEQGGVHMICSKPRYKQSMFNENIDEYPPVTGNDVKYEGELLVDDRKTVSVSVEEAANEHPFFRNRKQVMYMKNGLSESDFNEFAEESDAIIGELLEVLQNGRLYIVKYGKPKLEDKEAHEYLQSLLSAITKATNYINQQ